MSPRPLNSFESSCLAERASEELYRVRAFSWAALVVAQSTDSFGETESLRMDALTYQLEVIHASARQNEAMFDEAAAAIVRARVADREKQQGRRKQAT